jgi:ferredoxin
MRPELIPSRCMGHGVCQKVCPKVFKVDPYGMAMVVDDNPPAELHKKVREAVAKCPAKALLVDAG